MSVGPPWEATAKVAKGYDLAVVITFNHPGSLIAFLKNPDHAEYAPACAYILHRPLELILSVHPIRMHELYRKICQLDDTVVFDLQDPCDTRFGTVFSISFWAAMALSAAIGATIASRYFPVGALSR